MKSYPDSISCLDLSRIKKSLGGGPLDFLPILESHVISWKMSREHYTYYIYLNIQESNN